jgi:hypothetical protein
MKRLSLWATLWVALHLLTACDTTGTGSLAGASSEVKKAKQDELGFVDIARFDRDLQDALLGEPSNVTVAMFDKVSPNNTPERLQKWLNAVERHGGKVEIEPPPNELVPRNPLALISLVGGLLNVIKATTAIHDAQVTKAVKGRDAVISLERNAQGQVVVGKIIFKKNPPASQ